MQIGFGEVGVMGVYIFELNGRRVFEAPSKNLITDYGWNRLANLSIEHRSALQCQVGTSNTPPAITDTALGAFVASKTGSTNTIGTGTDVTGAYSYTQCTFAFSVGAVVGNIAEVGFKVTNADTSLTSRSLVKDGAGNPAVIVVTAADQLTVTYELRYYRAAIDVTGSVTVAGVPTTYIMRTGTSVSGTFSAADYLGGLNFDLFLNINHYGTGSVLGAPGVNPSGSPVAVVQPPITKTITVNPTNVVVAVNTSTIGTGSGNSSGGVVNLDMNPGIAGIGLFGAYGVLKAGFTPPIPKDNTKTIAYSFTFTFTRL